MKTLRLIACGAVLAPLCAAHAAPAAALVLARPATATMVVDAQARTSTGKSVPLPPVRPVEIAATANRSNPDTANSDGPAQALDDMAGTAELAAAESDGPIEASDEQASAEQASNEQIGDEQTAEVVEARSAAVLADGTPVPLPRVRPEYTPVRTAAVVGDGKGPFVVVDQATAAATREAIDNILVKRFDQAMSIQRRLPDPAAVKLVEFYYVRDGSLHAPYKRIRAFLDANPDWPNQEFLRRRFEVALLAQRAPDADVLEAFADTPPATTAGAIVFASALAATGDADRATEIVRTMWRTETMTEGEEKLILDRFADGLTRDDHRARMDRLLSQDETSAALRIARRLGADDMKLAEARIAVIRRSRSAESLLAKVPESLRSDPGYVLAKAQWYRRLGRYAEAAKVVEDAKFTPEQLAAPDEWSLERRIIARELIETGDTQGAYRLAAMHAAESPIDQLESEWHAGWIALRFLNDLDAAERHFTALKEIASTPISRSRGEYWLGRTSEAKGDHDAALKHYLAAGTYTTSYYGQLALARIGSASISEPRKPLIADTARRVLARRDSMRAMMLLRQIGLESDAARFMISMAQEARDEVTAVGVAETSLRMGLTSATVWIGKAAQQSGFPTELYAFATGGIPKYSDVGPGIDPAVVHAIARQESVFNPVVVSPAGARGLMQLMPGTAKATAKSYGQPYDAKRLTTDPRYNATLGAAHLGELARDYGKAYALVFAAYNAGPGRVTDWIKRFGDPRKGEIDPIDWVELIPFYETRNYVQRVLEGVQVYRASLGDDDRLLIAEDLRIPDPTGTVLADSADDSVPGVFSNFGDVDRTGTGSVPSSALGFGGN